MSSHKKIIKTSLAPAAIGSYSQAIDVGNTVYFSGQIPLDPKTMEMIGPEFEQQAHQVFKNLSALAEASGGSLESLVKLTVYLTNLENFGKLNEVMAHYFESPVSVARAAVQVSALPKGSLVEIDGVMVK